MRRRIVSLSGHTRQERNDAVAALTKTLGETSAIIEDVAEYSNRMSVFRFELDARELDDLELQLQALGIKLEPRDPQMPLDTDAEGYLMVTLAVVFPGEDGNRRVPNPDMG